MLRFGTGEEDGRAARHPVSSGRKNWAATAVVEISLPDSSDRPSCYQIRGGLWGSKNFRAGLAAQKRRREVVRPPLLRLPRLGAGI
jgi:hypothetical protein